MNNRIYYLVMLTHRTSWPPTSHVYVKCVLHETERNMCWLLSSLLIVLYCFHGYQEFITATFSFVMFSFFQLKHLTKKEKQTLLYYKQKQSHFSLEKSCDNSCRGIGSFLIKKTVMQLDTQTSNVGINQYFCILLSFND